MQAEFSSCLWGTPTSRTSRPSVSAATLKSDSSMVSYRLKMESLYDRHDGDSSEYADSRGSAVGTLMALVADLDTDQ
jgi:hypothetical protein